MPNKVFLCLSTGPTPEEREPVMATDDEELIRGFLALLARRLGVEPSRVRAIRSVERES